MSTRSLGTAVALLCVAAASCSAPASSSVSSSVPSPAESSAISSTPQPAASSGTTGPSALVLDEHADGTTVRVTPGTVLRVELHSTYWSPPVGDGPQTLVATGGTSSPAPSCRPGGGCGLVTATYRAEAPGTARLTAHRTSCGEAVVCPPNQRSFTVTVTVAPG
ncbi:hypothetical protein [Kitasatospora sp. SUK 42]|uniref:hypothetical protein n=1 Tax=Kitasatospora sp. SUK 42 TaxID=1588882 RepID=UPI0018CA3B3B|nr:hypothetical protein [Kitasatospora sp. SUK 42]MBV2153074.1 hypothetical protein [Kitasatospora sp. SUK 42]